MVIGNSTKTEAQINLAREAEFTLGPIKIFPPTLEAIIGERREIIEPRIMQVLVALARRRGEVVSRDDLIQMCWEGRAVGDDSINRCIARLRRLAEAEGGFAIETIPRVGYRLTETASENPVADVSPRLSWWQSYRVAIVSAILLIVVGTTAFIARDLQTEAPQGDAHRVAVLPFEALDSEKDAGFFGKALAEQITGVLNDNQVQPVSNVKSAALRTPDHDRTARNLGVDFILDGTVQRTKAGLHVTAHIDHAATHITLWTASFDQNSEDTIELQSQIAARVVDEIKAALRAAGTRNDEAISAYLKALENARIGGRGATNLRLALMRTVVAKAPDFSPGYSGLALSAAQLVQFSPLEAKALRAEARAAIGRALALDPKNSEAYLANAVLATEWNEQERLFRKGLAITPDEPTLNSTLAFLLEDEGRMAEALSLQQRAAIFDPLSPRKTAGWAASLAATGNIAQAHEAIERAAKLWPTNASVWSSRLYVLGLYGYEQEALALTAKAPPEREPDLLAALRTFFIAITNKTPAARAEAKRAILTAAANGHLDGGGAIELLAKLGETDTAFEVAERSYFSPGPADKYLRPNMASLFHPACAPLRRDPRFAPLVTRLGLMAYWKTHAVPDFCTTEDVPACRELKKGGRPPPPVKRYQ